MSTLEFLEIYFQSIPFTVAFKSKYKNLTVENDTARKFISMSVVLAKIDQHVELLSVTFLE